MTLWMVRTSWMRAERQSNGQSAAKRLSNGERSETVRDGMGLGLCDLPRAQVACLIFSPTPAKAELQVRKERAEMPLWRALAEARSYSSAWSMQRESRQSAAFHRSVGEPAEGSFPRDPNPTSQSCVTDLADSVQ